MKVFQLIEKLQELAIKHGDADISVITETPEIGQVQQILGDLSYSSSENHVYLLPIGFE